MGPAAGGRRDDLADFADRGDELAVGSGARPPVTVTDRQRQILLMMRDGLGNPTIGERLGITENTVRFHVKQIGKKLGVTSRIEIVVQAIARGVIPVEGDDWR